MSLFGCFVVVVVLLLLLLLLFSLPDYLPGIDTVLVNWVLIVQELCESRGSRPRLPVLNSPNGPVTHLKKSD